MKDQWGRINNKCQAIREFNICDMAYFLSLVKKNHENYPGTYAEWISWLEKESGENINKL